MLKPTGAMKFICSKEKLKHFYNSWCRRRLLWWEKVYLCVYACVCAFIKVTYIQYPLHVSFRIIPEILKKRRNLSIAKLFRYGILTRYIHMDIHKLIYTSM